MNPKWKTTDVGLEITGKLSVREFRQLLRVAGATVNVGPWLVGDAVEYGEHRWGEKYAQYVDETGLSPERIRVCSWVARRYPLPRRRAGLSFEVHRELAYVKDDDEQDELLDRAEEENWTSKEVREWKRNERGETNNHTPLWRITLDLSGVEDFDGEEFIECLDLCLEEWYDGDVKAKHSRPDGY